MRKYDKLVQQSFLNDEQAIIKRLKQVYDQSLKDINAKIAQLMSRSDANMSHVIYQVEYQKALKKQIESILNDLHTGQFSTISEYLVHCYDNGFMGAMYALQQQGIPLCIPIDQTQVVRAVQLDSKISNGLYTRLGEDVAELKKKITAQVSRGISTGMTYAQVAQQLAAYTNIGFNNAVRITRTEGHRIQVQSAMDAAEQAKEHGAEVVKQWDSTLDRRTRPAHKKVDGEIRELDEKFSNGLMFPGDPNGKASEVVNCRCALLQRAKWALDDEELETLKKRAEYFELDKSKDFEDFKKKYRKAVEQIKKEAHIPQTPELEQKRQAVSEYLRSLGAEVDNDGMVTLYHATGKENVPKIKKNGFKPTDAPVNGGTGGEEIQKRVFFGYDKEWISDTWSNDGNYEIMTVKIPAEYLHQFGKNTLEVVVEGTIRMDDGGIWIPDILPTSTAWDRKTVKRWLKKKG